MLLLFRTLKRYFCRSGYHLISCNTPSLVTPVPFAAALGCLPCAMSSTDELPPVVIDIGGGTCRIGSSGCAVPEVDVPRGELEPACDGAPPRVVRAREHAAAL